MIKKDMSKPVVIWGELLWDRFPDGDHLGGAPANVAWHLGQAGGWARLIARVGDDKLGRLAIEKLSTHIDTSLIQIDQKRPTGEVVVKIINDEPHYEVKTGCAWEYIQFNDDMSESLKNASAFIYGTSALRTEEGLGSWRKAIKKTVPETRVCDLNLRKTTEGLPIVDDKFKILEAIDTANILKINDNELRIITKSYNWNNPLEKLLSTCQIIIVTHGASGSTLYSRNHGPIEIEGVESLSGGTAVGCGDAYLGILVFGITNGWSLERSGGAASRWAAAVASTSGAMPEFSLAQIKDLLGSDKTL